jgi:hypothetical protein
MQAEDKIGFKVELQVVLCNSEGKVRVFKFQNLILSVGFDFISNAIGNTSTRPACMGWIGVGTGTAAATIAQTSLQTELARIAATYTHTTGTKAFSFSSTFAAGTATGAITEAGVFNAASNGIALDRVVFPVINKGDTDTLQMTFTFAMT